MPGIEPGRAPVIVAGIVVLREIMTAYGLDEIEVSERDVLHGAALAAAELPEPEGGRGAARRLHLLLRARQASPRRGPGDDRDGHGAQSLEDRISFTPCARLSPHRASPSSAYARSITDPHSSQPATALP